MLGRLGFVASVLSENLSTSRTCRLRNASEGRIRELIAENLAALDRVAGFLARHRIHLYRISSNLIPYASHPVNTVPWWEEHAECLRRIGLRLRRANVRISTHPGQYTVLNSPHAAIVTAARAELVYHARLLDALGAGADGKIVIHVGGLYAGSKAAAMERFISNARELPDGVRRRLIVENDDRLFDAHEALTVGRAVGIPVVFDWLHHRANPCRRPLGDVLAAIFATWTAADGRPKIHLSSQATGAPPGAHADFVDPDDMMAFLRVAPGTSRFDCMLEAKQKDRALLALRQQLETRGIVEAELTTLPGNRRRVSSR